MKYSFTGVCKVTFEHQPGDKSSSLSHTDFLLETSDNLDKSMYVGEEDIIKQDGVKPLTQVFIQGLVGNIHMAHEKGYWDSAAHLRYIISELERGFATVANVSQGVLETSPAVNSIIKNKQGHE